MSSDIIGRANMKFSEIKLNRNQIIYSLATFFAVASVFGFIVFLSWGNEETVSVLPSPSPQSFANFVKKPEVTANSQGGPEEKTQTEAVLYGPVPPKTASPKPSPTPSPTPKISPTPTPSPSPTPATQQTTPAPTPTATPSPSPQPSSSSSLNAPANLKAQSVCQNGSVKVQLDWDPVNNATGYKIYRDDELISEITTLSYLDDGVSSGSSHFYYVRSKSSAGESANSNLFSVSVCTSPSP